MTARERIEAALHHREPDRTPSFEYVLLSPVADQLLGRTYAGDPDNWAAFLHELGWGHAVRQNAVDRLDLAMLLGHDMMYVTPNPPSGEIAGQTEVSNGGFPEDPVGVVQSRNEDPALNAPPSEDVFLIYATLKEEMRQREVDLPILAPAYMHGVWTDVALMQTMILDPEAAHRHFALATARALTYIEKYLALGIDQVGVGGDFAGNRPLISPQAYRTFIVPEVRKLSQRIHRGKAYAVNASDGDLWSVLEDFVAGCEVDGYLEIDMHAGMDLAKLKAAYGNRVTLYGNLDCGNTLSFGTPEEVREHTKKCLEAGMGEGGHILCANNAIAASVPLENYLAVVTAYRDMFALPKGKLPF
ncbi:MAG: uroporphyrinogen decarboxylase family protein [Candidatus Latescibacterota bacterium]